MVEKLATFTVEFGICIQNGEKKAFGAGLLSSFGELKYSLSDKPELAPFEPYETCQTKYPITEYQPKYYVAESFADAKNKLTDWASTIPRQFQVKYNPYTQRIVVLENTLALHALVRDIKGQVSKLEEALKKMSHENGSV